MGETRALTDGDADLAAAAGSLGVDLVALAARTAIWVHPEVVRTLAARRPDAEWFPATRRAFATRGEARRGVVDGVKLDDNTAANLAIKQAVFEGAAAACRNYACCHVWPESCRDPRCHTSLANLTLVPRALAGLTDHDAAVGAALRRRSYDLYGWTPPGLPPPPVPAVYPPPAGWRAPIEPGPAVWRRVARKIAAA